MADLADLERKQADMAKAAGRIAEERDPERILEMAGQLAAGVQELEAMARRIEAATTPAGGAGAATVVVLTREQRARIAEQTGVGLETVTVRDTPERKWSREMPRVEPRTIEKIAAQQAAESRLLQETRDQLEKIIREIEAVGAPGLEKVLEELKRHPALAG